MAPTTAGEIKDVCLFAVDELNESDGEISALEQSIKAKALMKSLEAYLDQIAGKALEEARKEVSEKKKTFTKFGASVSIKDTGVKWHYDKTNDAEITGLFAAAVEVKSQIDARAKFLQSLQKPLTELDEETGEVLSTIYPAYKTGTTSVVVSFGKEDNE